MVEHTRQALDSFAPKMRQMYQSGVCIEHIMREFSCSRDAVLRRVDTEKYEKHKAQKALSARISRQNRIKPEKRDSTFNRAAGPRSVRSDEIAARLAQVPADTRNLTAFTFGDPLPGRSALDRMRAAQ